VFHRLKPTNLSVADYINWFSRQSTTVKRWNLICYMQKLEAIKGFPRFSITRPSGTGSFTGFPIMREEGWGAGA
jgi:hypothetical protein